MATLESRGVGNLEIAPGLCGMFEADLNSMRTKPTIRRLKPTGLCQCLRLEGPDGGKGIVSITPCFVGGAASCTREGLHPRHRRTGEMLQFGDVEARMPG